MKDKQAIEELQKNFCSPSKMVVEICNNIDCSVDSVVYVSLLCSRNSVHGTKHFIATSMVIAHREACEFKDSDAVSLTLVAYEQMQSVLAVSKGMETAKYSLATLHDSNTRGYANARKHLQYVGALNLKMQIGIVKKLVIPKALPDEKGELTPVVEGEELQFVVLFTVKHFVTVEAPCSRGSKSVW
jgi:hypothetical protein